MKNTEFRIPLVGSAVSLFIGGILLIGKVPSILTVGTMTVVVILIALTFLISKYKILVHLGGILGILAIISSATAPAHNEALLNFGKSAYITVLDILMVLGFYIFPTIYIYFWVFAVIRRKTIT
ncbi:hypothetical protein [Acidianus sp. HS-5]|uniref:hypothetical protein n=1 Tax=Acidianus sp. HS-5 TaxID=2886040 RepID=UPI001F46ECD0|nr:hypothetical protein [Acidianus sp. HS-5]BDC18174.1 hypothetical protein HS5_10640 [Acidianus sp. HS-5]